MALASGQRRENERATTHSSMKALRFAGSSSPSRRAKRPADTHWIDGEGKRSMPHFRRWVAMLVAISRADARQMAFAVSAGNEGEEGRCSSPASRGFSKLWSWILVVE